MTQPVLDWVKDMRDQYLSGVKTVLEVGSRDFNGTPRVFFPDTEYLGIDMTEGKGVDLVQNSHDLDISKLYDLVICCETLEHDDLFWRTLANMRKVVRMGGWMIITTPTFGFPTHRYPKDYYRFGEDAYRDVLFQDFEILDLREVFSPKGHHPGLACLGRKFT